MVIRLPGIPAQRGPQPGPAPAWARFTRTEAADTDKSTSVSLQAYKPDITAYRVLGREPQADPARTSGVRERNAHNSSVYVAHLDRARGKPASSLARLPVVVEIAAGQYDVTVAFQEYDCLDHEGGVLVEKALARGGAYALRVRGTSMTHVGIEPGDVIIVRPQTWADDGDFVVANFTDGVADGAEGLATLKRFYKRRDHVFLQSATASTDPIRLFPNRGPERDTVRVQGVVTVVLKA
jgi:SOS-response transcriptional repressor LexA